jgi:hypothetical protein
MARCCVGKLIMASFSISANIIDVLHQTIFPGTVFINNGHIQAIAWEISGGLLMIH